MVQSLQTAEYRPSFEKAWRIVYLSFQNSAKHGMVEEMPVRACLIMQQEEE